MSLSFPGLLSAVPLYRIDYGTLRNRDTDRNYPTRIGTKVWFLMVVSAGFHCEVRDQD
jgi:hypothetical protein